MAKKNAKDATDRNVKASNKRDRKLGTRLTQNRAGDLGLRRQVRAIDKRLSRIERVLGIASDA